MFEEVQCYLYILQFVESHAALFSGLGWGKKEIFVWLDHDRNSCTFGARTQHSVKMENSIGKEIRYNDIKRKIWDRLFYAP